VHVWKSVGKTSKVLWGGRERERGVTYMDNQNRTFDHANFINILKRNKKEPHKSQSIE